MRIIRRITAAAGWSAEPIGRGLRSTRARRLILDCVRATDAHPTAEWVFGAIRRRIPRVSLGTVYRNLRVLVEAGLVVERPGPGGSRFDANVSEHHHFTCIRCRRVVDLTQPVDHQLDRQVESGTGFEVLGHRLEFFGRCEQCNGPLQGGHAWQGGA